MEPAHSDLDRLNDPLRSRGSDPVTAADLQDVAALELRRSVFSLEDILGDVDRLYRQVAIALYTAAEALRSYPEPLQASLRHLVTLMVYIDPAEPKHPVPGDQLALSASGIIASQQDLAIDVLRLMSEAQPPDDRVANRRVADLVAFPLLAATFGACAGALPDDMRLALSDLWDPPTTT